MALEDYGLTPAPEVEPHYRRQRLHELGITGSGEGGTD
jgi:hypothetical protein